MKVRRGNRLAQQQDDRRNRGDSAHKVYVTAGIHSDEAGLGSRHYKLPRSPMRVKSSGILVGLGDLGFIRMATHHVLRP